MKDISRFSLKLLLVAFFLSIGSTLPAQDSKHFSCSLLELDYSSNWEVLKQQPWDILKLKLNDASIPKEQPQVVVMIDTSYAWNRTFDEFIAYNKLLRELDKKSIIEEGSCEVLGIKAYCVFGNMRFMPKGKSTIKMIFFEMHGQKMFLSYMGGESSYAKFYPEFEKILHDLKFK